MLYTETQKNETNDAKKQKTQSAKNKKHKVQKQPKEPTVPAATLPLRGCLLQTKQHLQVICLCPLDCLCLCL